MRKHSSRGTRTLSVLVVGLMAIVVVAVSGVAAGAATKSATDSALAHLKITADNVTIKQKGKTAFVAAKDGMALKQGDTIKTDETGRAEIDYTDGSITRLAGS